MVFEQNVQARCRKYYAPLLDLFPQMPPPPRGTRNPGENPDGNALCMNNNEQKKKTILASTEYIWIKINFQITYPNYADFGPLLTWHCRLFGLFFFFSERTREIDHFRWRLLLHFLFRKQSLGTWNPKVGVSETPPPPPQHPIWYTPFPGERDSLSSYIT